MEIASWNGNRGERAEICKTVPEVQPLDQKKASGII